MAKDYAKRVLTTYKKTQKKRVRIEFFIIPLVVVAILGYWTFSHRDKWSSINILALLKSHHAAKKSHSELAVKPVESEEMNIHFDFYNQLPNQRVPEVELSSTDTASKHPIPAPIKTNKVAQTAGEYVLLFGQFKNPSEAGELRISLLLADCEAEMVEVKGPDGKVFRVQKGHFASQAEAKNLQNQLEKKGVVSELQKV